MEIVDAQIHAPIPLDPWPPSLGRNVEQVVSAELANAAMEAVGVDAAVLYASLAQCEAAHARYPARFAGVISVDDPAQVPDPAMFADLVGSTPGILGFRILAGHPGSAERLAFLRAGRWEPALAAAEQADLPVVLFAPLQMPLVAAVAAAHPGLRLIVDHLGLPPPPSFPMSPRFLGTVPELLALARAPNVAVKLTGAPALSWSPYPFRDLWPVLHEILTAFGPGRVMWGSDFTRVTGRNCHPRHRGGRHTYAELVDYLRSTAEVGAADKAALFGGTVRDWFRWPR